MSQANTAKLVRYVGNSAKSNVATTDQWLEEIHGV